MTTNAVEERAFQWAERDRDRNLADVCHKEAQEATKKLPHPKYTPPRDLSMNEQELQRKFASIAEGIEQMVLDVTGDVMAFEPASYEELLVLDEIGMQGLARIFYEQFAPTKMICGEEFQLLPIDGIRWYAKESCYGSSLRSGNQITIAINYSGAPYCLDLGTEVVRKYGITAAMEVTGREEAGKLGKVVAEGFTEFLRQLYR